MTIPELEARIVEDNKKIDKLNELKGVINKITSDCGECVSSLNSTANSFSQGIQISGTDMSANINEHANVIGNFGSTASGYLGQIDSKVNELNDDISWCRSEIARIRAEEEARRRAAARKAAEENNTF